MKYMVTVTGVCLADANEILRFCSGRGFGLPEISEDRKQEQCETVLEQPFQPHPHRTRREIIMTVVSDRGESFTGGAAGVAKHIAHSTGRGVSPAHMMAKFRRGEKFRGYAAIITKDSTRHRKGSVISVASIIQREAAQ